MNFRLLATLALVCLPTATSQAATLPETADARAVDLVKLIECTTYDVPSYNGLAFWLTGEEAADATRHFGLTEEASGNPYLRQYRLAEPIAVFGRRADRIVFTASGPMAVLDEADPHPVARQVDVAPSLDTAGKYLGERQISLHEETIDGVTVRMRISLNISTVDSHPGKVLAGCSYAIEVE